MAKLVVALQNKNMALKFQYSLPGTQDSSAKHPKLPKEVEKKVVTIVHSGVFCNIKFVKDEEESMQFCIKYVLPALVGKEKFAKMSDHQKEHFAL